MITKAKDLKQCIRHEIYRHFLLDFFLFSSLYFRASSSRHNYLELTIQDITACVSFVHRVPYHNIFAERFDRVHATTKTKIALHFYKDTLHVLFDQVFD